MFLVAAALSVLVHELGHAFFQRLFRIPVELIEWGNGPKVFQISKFQLRLFPFSGAIRPAGTAMVQSKWKGVLIALGGVLAQWLVVGVLIISKSVTHPSLRVFSESWLFFAFLVLTQLLPIGQRDGAKLMQVLRRD